MRPDKSTAAGVALTLGLYRAGRATSEIPVWRMISTPLDALRKRAAAIADAVGAGVEVVELRSTVGGGSLPGETMPSVGLALAGRAATRRLADLRRATPSIIGRIEDGRVVLDLRTVDPGADEAVAAAVAASVAGAGAATRTP